jgi:D-amino-acid dehydrogenase
VYGYSVTSPLRHDDPHLHLEPRAALMDERYKVAISRMGNRVRVAGSAEIGTASARRAMAPS